MRKISLRLKDKLVFVDDDDYEYINQWDWYLHTQKNRLTNYAYTKIRGDDGKLKTVMMHRLILNATKGMEVDHINHNGLDNQKVNLRECTCSQNHYNRNKNRIGKTSIYKGVSLIKQKYKNKTDKSWVAYIQVDKKSINLGSTKTELEAAKLYNEAASKYFGEFALLNII